MKEQCLCLQDSKKDDEFAVPVCVQEHECYYPNPPHPTPPATDDERAVPVSAGQRERWWGCRACVCTGTWTLLSHPTPPHPTVRLLPPFGGKQNQSLVAVSTFKNLTPASDWFWRVLLPQVIESYCRKWFLTYRRKWLNLTAASDGWAGSTWFYTWGNLQ